MPVTHLYKTETKTFEIPIEAMVDDTEVLIGAATAPKNPTYDTAKTSNFRCDTQTNAGTTANIFWGVIRLPSGYLPGSDISVLLTALTTLGGDAVLVAGGTTVDLEAFLYSATAGDYNSADIQATAAIAVTATIGVKTFTITGTTLAAGDSILLRFTSSVQITSAGGAGTGLNGFANFKYTATCRV